MQRASFGLVIFWLGVLFLHSYSTLIYLWGVTGIPVHYPFYEKLFPLSSPLGIMLMIIGGLLYSIFANKEVAK